MPNAAIATTMPTMVSVVRSLCRNALRRTSRGKNIGAGVSREGPPRPTDPPLGGQRAERAWGDVSSSVDEQALFEMHHSMRLLGRLRVVRHHDDRLAELVVQP